jgi:hypothetical protein
MKQSTYKILGLALMLIWATNPLKAFVNDQDFAKVIEKSFDISSNGTVDLSNKYGNMAIKTWNKQKVEIRVTIEVSAKSEKAAEKLFEKVNIEFENSSDFVKAMTDFKGGGSWGTGNKITVNYLVNMPATCLLEASNKYGNVNIESLSNGAQLEIAYGAIYTQSISGSTNLDLAYSKGVLGELGKFNAEVKYSGLEIATCKNAKIESKYSQIKIKEAGRIELDSKYGEFNFGTIKELINEGKYDRFSINALGSVSLNSSYTDIEIGTLGNELSIELRYGNISVDKLLADFTEVSVETEYADVSLGVEKEGKMQLSLSGHYIDVRLPDSFEITSDSEGDRKDRQVIGYMKSSNGAPVNISMEYGSFRLKD